MENKYHVWNESVKDVCVSLENMIDRCLMFCNTDYHFFPATRSHCNNSHDRLLFQLHFIVLVEASVFFLLFTLSSV